MTQEEPLLTSTEVAELCRVSRKTITVWAKAGHLAAIRLPGGALRFRKTDVNELLEKAAS